MPITAGGPKMYPKSVLDIVADASAHVPTPLVIMVALTAPWWREWLLGVSDALALAAPALAVALALLKMYEATRDRSAAARTDAATGLAKAAGTAAVAGAKASGLGVLAAVAMAALALVWIVQPKRADAAPATVTQTATVKGRKRKTADDAGDDGDVADVGPAGHEPAWMATARADIGTRETAGRRHNPKVVRYFADCGTPHIKDDETAWCAAFVGAHLERAGVPCSKAVNARSYEKWGERIERPTVGCIVVLWRGSPTSWQGHVGFYVGETPTHVLLLGGNQGDAVSVAKFPKRQVLSYRVPRKSLKTETAALASAGAGAVAIATQTVQHIEPLQHPLREMGYPWALKAAAIIGLIAATVAVIAAVRAARQRRHDYKTRGI